MPPVSASGRRVRRVVSPVAGCRTARHRPRATPQRGHPPQQTPVPGPDRPPAHPAHRGLCPGDGAALSVTTWPGRSRRLTAREPGTGRPVVGWFPQILAVSELINKGPADVRCARFHEGRDRGHRGGHSHDDLPKHFRGPGREASAGRAGRTVADHEAGRPPRRAVRRDTAALLGAGVPLDAVWVYDAMDNLSGSAGRGRSTGRSPPVSIPTRGRWPRSFMRVAWP